MPNTSIDQRYNADASVIQQRNSECTLEVESEAGEVWNVDTTGDPQAYTQDNKYLK